MHTETNICALGLAGMKLTFFNRSYVVVCLGLVAKTLDNALAFWLLQNSDCTASMPSLPYSGPHSSDGGQEPSSWNS